MPFIVDASLTDLWPNEQIMDLDWTGSFTSNSSMYYEITIGKTIYSIVITYIYYHIGI